MTKEKFSELLPSLPNQPGVYRYYDSKATIIYVGKAKNLKKRISSYFNKKLDSTKTQRLVHEIVRIEFTIVNTEQDALFLENSLIKQYQPKYNMILKDDKSYPFLVIKNEPFPRIFLTRRRIKDGSEYIGPFTSPWHVKDMLQLIKQTLPFRTCKLNLSRQNIEQRKFKPCLEYQIGNCKAPCIGLQTEVDYAWQIEQVRQIFKGKLGSIVKHYKEQMQLYAADLEFEKAEIVRQRLQYLDNYQSKSVVAIGKNISLDVISIVSDMQSAVVNYMVVVQGHVIHTLNKTIEKKLDESNADILSFTFERLRNDFKSSSRVIVSNQVFEGFDELDIQVPKGGDKKQLLELSIKNVQYAYEEVKRKRSLLLDDSDSQNVKLKILSELQEALKLKDMPRHIECFDNSNFQGSYPVSAMVCFKDGVPSKSDYRHYHIRTVQGINDFASMSEVVYRRYKRVLDEKKPLPNLIIIDGGKGQLSAAMKSIESLDLQKKVTVIGLAKNVEELFFPYDTESIKLPFQSDMLNLIKYIRDEVHRFGITFHRNTRSKGVIKNELSEIDGIGEATATKLMAHFKSVKKVKSATIDELSEVVGKSKATILVNSFSSI